MFLHFEVYIPTESSRVTFEVGTLVLLQFILNCGTLFALQSSTSIDAFLRIVVLCVLNVGEC